MKKDLNEIIEGAHQGSNKKKDKTPRHTHESSEIPQIKTLSQSFQKENKNQVPYLEPDLP